MIIWITGISGVGKTTLAKEIYKKLKKKKMEIPPEDYLCPISNELMDDPVFTADGISYDRKSIEEWF